MAVVQDELTTYLPMHPRMLNPLVPTTSRSALTIM